MKYIFNVIFAITFLLSSVGYAQNNSGRALDKSSGKSRLRSISRRHTGGSSAESRRATGPYWDAIRIQKERSFTDAIKGRGFARSQAWEKAITCYERALTLDKTNDIAYIGLAECYGELGQWRKSIANYRKVMYSWSGKKWGSSVSNDYDQLFKFTLALQKAGEGREMQTVYRKALDRSPDRLASYLYVPDGVHEFDNKKMLASIHLALAGMAEWDMRGGRKEDREPLRQRQFAEIKAAMKIAPDYGPAYLMYSKALESEATIAYRYKGQEQAKLIRLQAAKAYKRAAELGSDGTIFSPRLDIPSHVFIFR